jgi:23S rRNA pseudouridine2604 synthase
MPDLPNVPVRLDRRVSALTGCSRSEAEQYVEGGWVRVDGEVVDEPQFPILGQSVSIDPEAKLGPTEPATMLWHKPVGVAVGDGPQSALPLIVPAGRWAGDASGVRLLKRHFPRLQPAMPLEPDASGLMVFSQDGRVLRHLADAGAKLEQEWIVDVDGELAPYGWARVTGGTSFAGWPVAPFKVSWQSEQRLRFAIKGVRPGMLAHLCAQVGLRATALRRIRLGRIPLAKMAPGEWRYLPVAERF